MNSTQIQTTLAPIISFIAGLLAAKFAWFDAATWSSIIAGVAGLGATIWAAIASRNSAVAATTQNMTGVTVQTTSAAAPAVTAAVQAAKAS